MKRKEIIDYILEYWASYTKEELETMSDEELNKIQQSIRTLH